MEEKDIICSIGKDGRKRYFKNGKRVKMPSTPLKCSKKPATPKKTPIKTPKKIEKKVITPGLTPPSQKVLEKLKKGQESLYHIWEIKTGYTSILPNGNVENYWSVVPEGKIGKTFELPIRHVSHISKYNLETKIPDYITKNPEKYAVYDHQDHSKLLKYPESLESEKLEGFEKILPLKNRLKYVWTFRTFKRPGGESYTFIKPVLAFFKMRKGLKDMVKNQNPNTDLFYGDSDANQAMKEIVEMRENWNEDQWNIFENNFYLKITIFSKLKKL